MTGRSIQPMQERWKNLLQRYDEEEPKGQEATEEEMIVSACR